MMNKDTSRQTVSSFATINGTQLYYEVAGAGHPLVLLHGHDPFDHRFWDLQFAFFAQYYRVLRFDARGYGKSPAPTHPYTREADLFAFLKYLDIQPAYL